MDRQLFSHDVVIDQQYVDAGEEVTITATVRNFSEHPVISAAPLEVTFTDLSTGTPGPDSWIWDFGDRASSTRCTSTPIPVCTP